MKLSVLLYCCFIGCSGVFAQEHAAAQKREQGEEIALPVDERGKYIYYEVVPRIGKSVELLKKSAKAYFDGSTSPKIQFSAQDSLWIGKGKLVLNKTAFVLTRPSGEVHYQLYLDFKEEKYRFWLTDFIFIPYQRDRYGNFVPATPIGSPLEQKPGKLNAAEWESYLKATAKEAQLFADQFKKGMLMDTAIIAPTAKAVPLAPTKDQKW